MLKVFHLLVVRSLIVIGTEVAGVVVASTVVTGCVWVSPLEVVLLAVD